MQKQYDAFTRRDTIAFAISQEDKDLASHGKFLKYFGDDGPPFRILADLNRAETGRLDRATTYLVDKSGTIVEIFPATVTKRPNWDVVLGRIDQMK